MSESAKTLTDMIIKLSPFLAHFTYEMATGFLGNLELKINYRMIEKKNTIRKQNSLEVKRSVFYSSKANCKMSSVTKNNEDYGEISNTLTIFRLTVEY